MEAKIFDGALTPDNLKRSRILIVDDQQALLESMQALLRISGYTVDIARSGARALELLQEDIFQLLLLDLQMPGVDGHEVMRFIDQHEMPRLRIMCRGCLHTSF